MGLMQALELVKDRESKEPAKEELGRVLESCREQGLLVGRGGLYGNIIRMSPPMSASKADVDQAVSVLDKAFQSLR